MPFTAVQEAEVLKALGAKITQACPSCGQRNRQLVPDVFVFQAQALSQPKPTYSQNPSSWKGNLKGLPMGNPTMPPPGSILYASLPSVAVICMTCGVTEFYNVHVLNVAKVLGIPPPGELFGTP
jgi:hypothetical protein